MSNVQYREVKRKASVGERIKIVNPRLAVGYGYGDSGDVVSLIGDEGARAMLNGELRALFNNEYVVLEPVANASTPQEPDALAAAFRRFVLDNADAIRAILPALETQLSAEPPVRKALSKPLTRAEVIAKATADVAELLRIGHDAFSDLPEASPLYGKFYSVEFHVNREKRAVTALVKRGRTVYAKATAKAAPDDVFHAEIGKAIALRRALGLTVPGEYTDAPKPTPATGAIAIYHGPFDDKRTTLTERVASNDGSSYGDYAFMHTAYGGWIADKQYVIIDDTDVDYSVSAGNAA